MLAEVNKKLQLLLDGLDAPDNAASGVCVASVIYRLARSDHWTGPDLIDLEQLSKRIDITRKLYSRYDENWRKTDDQLLQEPWLGMAVLLLYKAFLVDNENNANRGSLAKRINVLLKGLDLAQASFLAEDSTLWRGVMDEFTCLGEQSACDDPRTVTSASYTEKSTNSLKKIPLTVLFFEGPIARAYLETIRSLGLAPKKIINMASSVDVSDGKPVGRIFPKVFRKIYAATIQRNRIHHWAQHIRSKQPGLVNSITSELQQKFSFSEETQKRALDLLPLSEYSDNVDTRLFTGIKDTALLDYLAAEPASTILFTGGGIVPDSLLSLENLKLIHIHPGYLPDIRGADCVLWSTFLTGHASATCFYMSPGIDTGDIVEPCWLPKVRFDFDAADLDTETLYRTMYCYFDPWVRSYALREVIGKHRNFHELPSVSQSEDEGLTYHFMHKQFQALALKGLVNSN